MSAFVKIETEFSDVDCIVKALSDLGYSTVEIHDEAVPLVGYRGDVREQRANVVVRRKHIGPASNDLGFVRRPDGTYEMLISEYDRSALPKAAKFASHVDMIGFVKQRYAVHAVTKSAAASKWKTVGDVAPVRGEAVRVKLVRWS